MLAFFMECACPPDRRSLTVGAGDIDSVDEFLSNYSLTHIVCDACGTYHRLIGYIDHAGNERRVGPYADAKPEPARRAKRATSLSRLRK